MENYKGRINMILSLITFVESVERNNRNDCSLEIDKF